MSKIPISYFSTATDNIPKNTTLGEELKAIKEGRVKEIIENCRLVYNQGNKDEYSKLKKKLPAVTYAATFTGKRAKDACNSYNNMLIIDFDGIENVDETKNTLIKDKYTHAAWISPSGKGIKVLVKVTADPNSHKYAFDGISEYYNETYNLETDKSGSDITRLCFTSYDPELFFNASSDTWIEQKLPVKKTKEVNSSKQDQSKTSRKEFKATVNPNVTEGKNDSKNRTDIKNIIKYLTRNNKSITSTYQNWYRVAFGIATSFTPDIGIKHYLELCRLDKESHNEEKSLAFIEYCYRNNKGEIKFVSIVHLAKEAGFKWRILEDNI